MTDLSKIFRFVAFLQPGEEVAEEGDAFFQVGDLDEFVACVGLGDGARTADYHRQAAFLELAGFGGESDGARDVVAG